MKILELIKGGGKGEAVAQAILAELNSSKQAVRIELEHVPIRFYSRVLLRSGAVMLTYPQDLNRFMKIGEWVRLRPVEEEIHELRLQISSSRFGGTGPLATEVGQMALLCKIPGATYEESKRTADRLSTHQFKNVVLEIHSYATPYRVLDLSTHGLKIRLSSEEALDDFPIGKYLRKGGVLHLGSKAHISILDLIPRHHGDQTVGLEMVVNPEGPSTKILAFFLDRLKRGERRLTEQ